MPAKQPAPSGKPRRGGRPSFKAVAFVVANAGTMTPDAMALKLDRPKEWVLKILSENSSAEVNEETKDRDAIKYELRNSPAMDLLHKELTAEEIRFFEDEYVSYIRQFKRDVLHTERNQIFKAIKYGILMNRNFSSQKKDMRVIRKLEMAIEAIDDQFKTVDELPAKQAEKRERLEMRLEAVFASKQAKTTEYVKLEEKQQKIFRELKATREQRETKFENANTDFLSLIKALYQREKREQEDRQQALAERVLNQERARLSRNYKFADGSIDQPLLNCDSVTGRYDNPEKFKEPELIQDDQDLQLVSQGETTSVP